MRHFAFSILALTLLFACTSQEDPAEEVPEEVIFGESQVYAGSRYALYGVGEKAPYDRTCNVVGEPRIFGGGGHIPSSTDAPLDFPWIIEGKINKGIMEIVFPNAVDSLDSRYGKTYTEGVRVAHVYLWNKEARAIGFALLKLDDNVLREIYIYYSEGTISTFNNGSIVLNRGWNFVEIIDRGQKVGRISQDINIFLKDGYRWEAETWVGTGPNS